MKTYFVYILASASGRLYVGMTSNLPQRMHQHKTKQFKGFTARYNINKLLYFEDFNYVYDAMDRERQLKGWTRRKKVSLFAELNPGWDDLSAGWFDDSVNRST
jgi:putative endonuclease